MHRTDRSPGRHVRLGYYDYEEEAARAYDAEARKLFGRSAMLNFSSG